MKYELAKELKDAGFKQNTDKAGQFDYIDKNGNRGNLNADESFYCPTLSELIEACGVFSSLTKSPRGTWYCARSEGSVEMVVGDEYSTPEEAVANLWLELNKK